MEEWFKDLDRQIQTERWKGLLLLTVEQSRNINNTEVMQIRSGKLYLQAIVQVMETRKRVLGSEHSDTLTSMANLASTFWNQGRRKEAEKLNVQVTETRKRMLESEHPQ
jgi:citrate lyase synthetase